MPKLMSLSLCSQVTLNLHSLNNEGNEGNQQQTRMVHVVDQHGQRAVVNAISGDMFKHILVEHLVPLLEQSGQPLSAGAHVYDADRINADKEFVAFCQEKQPSPDGGKDKLKVTDSAVMTRMLTQCSLTDLAGALVTQARAVGRKSVVEFGWAPGLPDSTVTEQYFHVKYAPEGRQGATGGDTVAGRQAIFHRPASSGVYALLCHLELARIGLNDITRQYVVSPSDRRSRARALIQALAATLVKPSGAQRNTQNPHIVGCRGIIAASTTALPAPTVSPLNDNYRDEMIAVASVLNRITPDSVECWSFDTLAGAVEILAKIAAEVEVPEA